MGYIINKNSFDHVIKNWLLEYSIFAPICYKGGGSFSDTDCIRYGKIESVNDIVFDKKSQYSFKEILLPAAQTLFYFTENQVTEPDIGKNGVILFLRSCDVHGLKRLDDIYLNNGPADVYYKRFRDRIKIVLMGCTDSFDNCFCVSMGTEMSSEYDLGINIHGDDCHIDCKNSQWSKLLAAHATTKADIVPDHVDENQIRVNIPETLNTDIMTSSMWNTYDSRCINCGRCNFVCPTCTCFTMQDLFYTDNKNVGERRRVWASCMVDGFTDVAGGGSYRQKNGQRMRFKVMHKVSDYKERFGYHMCVGCGRCDDICPEYISFSNCINQLESAAMEVDHHDQ